MNTVKLAMLETAHIGVESFEQFYKTIFKRLGYETKVFRVGANDETSHAGSGIFENESIDVFVSDLSLGKQDTYDGLTVIKKIKRIYPNLLVIANSMTNVTFVEAASHIPSFDLFVCKSKMSDKVYQDYIVSKLKGIFKRNVYLDECDLELNKSKLFRKKKDRLQLIDILKSITFTSHNIDEFTAVKRIILSPIFGGYSDSEVFRLSAFTSSNLKCINAVLKVSSNESYLEERDNYLKYVKWYLPYTWRPELIGCAETRDFGALCYSFVYNDEVPFKSLTECLRDKNDEKLEIAIDSIFDPKHQRWYHKNNIQKGIDLTGYYYNKWFFDRITNEQEFCSIIRNIGEVRENAVLINEHLYPRPQGYLLGIPRKEHSTCICHGDLNSNNVLVSDNSCISFIDFQNTKRGHVFEDFVVFEVCIRLYVNFNETISTQINDEWELNKASLNRSCDYAVQNNSTRKRSIYPQILKLRKYANLNAPEESDINYYYALALYCFRLLRIDSFHDWQKGQVVSCLLSAERMVEFLENGACDKT